jgi:predicted CXXCH cytochrome family protein
MRWLGQTIAVGVVAAAAAAVASAGQSTPAAQPQGKCAKCHAEQGADIAAAGGAHAEMACGDCHSGKHPPKSKDDLPTCTGCHEGHGSAMTEADCAKCHGAHRPREVRYGLDVPAALCAPCHEDAAKLMTATASRHKPLRCAICHQREHGATKVCADCHGSPHDGAAVAPAEGCGCHGPAHDLGNPAKP